MSRPMQFKDKVAIVTGGNRGIGKEIALHLGREGCRVVVAGRDLKSLQGSVQAIEKAGGQGYAVKADVRKVKDVQTLVQKALQKFGRVDFLINNAGIGRFAEIVNMSDEDFQETLETNLFGVFYCTRAVLPAMIKQQQGHIVNISSLAGKNNFAAGAAYCASKHGLIAFAECLMLEVRHHNIKVSTICPGSVQTSFSRGFKDKEWALTATDVAGAVIDVLSTSSQSLISLVDLRPLRPPRK